MMVKEVTNDCSRTGHATQEILYDISNGTQAWQTKFKHINVLLATIPIQVEN